MGCYVSVNGRLLDVVVLSDPEYLIKIPITNKSSDRDKVQMLFKFLTVSDSDEPIGNCVSS